MTEILTYDSNRIGRSFDERDAVMGAMLITTLQWIEPTGFGLTRDMLFTNSQYRIMGSILREFAIDSTSQGQSNVMVDLFNKLYELADPENVESSNIVPALYNLHTRIRFWNSVDQVAATLTGNKTLYDVLMISINDNYPFYNNFLWVLELVVVLEWCFDKGLNIVDLVNEFFYKISEESILIEENKIQNSKKLDIVVESNIATIVRNCEDPVWRVVDSFIEIDRHNANADQQYIDSRPFIWNASNQIASTIPGSSGAGAWDSRYEPVYVKQKDMVNREEDTFEFPFLSFNNRTFKLIASIPSKHTPISTEDTVSSLNTVTNGLMPLVNTDDRIVSNIVGLTINNGYGDGGTEKRHYFHCKNGVGDDEIIEFNSSFDYGDPLEVPAVSKLMNACTFAGKIFSIDPIQIKYSNISSTIHQCLLITGDFTLTETSTSNVFTNIAIWNPLAQEFLEYNISQSMNDVVSNAANFFANETLIYKTDSYSKFINGDNTHCPVVFGFGTRLYPDNGIVKTGMFDMSGPFFILDVITDNTEPTPVIRLNFILPKDIEGMNETITNYQEWLSDLTSYTVQKIGSGYIPGEKYYNQNDEVRDLYPEVSLYTGKGIFFLDLFNLRISDKSFYLVDQFDDPEFTYKIPVEGLSGEVSNFHNWIHPTKSKENWAVFPVNNESTGFNKSFIKFVSLDDRFNSNIFQNNVYNNGNYRPNIKLIVASGWSKLGGLANTPADYNNVRSNDEYNHPTIDLVKTADGTLVEDPKFSDWLHFNEQTKLILAKLENQLQRYEAYGEGFEGSISNAFYSFEEIELPMGYGEIVYSAHLAISYPPPAPLT